MLRDPMKIRGTGIFDAPCRLEILFLGHRCVFWEEAGVPLLLVLFPGLPAWLLICAPPIPSLPVILARLPKSRLRCWPR
jgi:hypothetical protein